MNNTNIFFLIINSIFVFKQGETTKLEEQQKEKFNFFFYHYKK